MALGSAEREDVVGRAATAAGAPRVTLSQGTKAVVAWIATSLAGLTAIVYAAGYFLFHAHLNMLGLGDVVSFPHDQMLLEGGRFFLFSISRLIWDCVIGGLMLAIVLIAVALLREVKAITDRTQRIGAWVNRRRAAIAASHPRLGGALVLALFVSCLAAHAKYYYYPLYSLQELANLLFSRPGPPLKTAQDCIAFLQTEPELSDFAARIVSSGSGHCQNRLAFEFDGILEEYLLLIISGGIIFHYTSKVSDGIMIRLMRLLLAAYILIFTLLLPVAFGVLVRIPIYPAVEITPRNGTLIKARLLKLDSNGVTIWEEDRRRISWQPITALGSIQVTCQGNLFDSQEYDRCGISAPSASPP
jgi:hypothetical protein